MPGVVDRRHDGDVRGGLEAAAVLELGETTRASGVSLMQVPGAIEQEVDGQNRKNKEKT
jgi:hypothetical protein